MSSVATSTGKRHHQWQVSFATRAKRSPEDPCSIPEGQGRLHLATAHRWQGLGEIPPGQGPGSSPRRRDPGPQRGQMAPGLQAATASSLSSPAAHAAR
jgi:hypothetical protein